MDVYMSVPLQVTFICQLGVSQGAHLMAQQLAKAQETLQI